MPDQQSSSGRGHTIPVRGRFSGVRRSGVRRHLISLAASAGAVMLLAPLVAASAQFATVTSAASQLPKVSQLGPTGMNVDQAFSTYTEGDPNVLIAYVEGGINWHLGEAASLADRGLRELARDARPVHRARPSPPPPWSSAG